MWQIDRKNLITGEESTEHKVATIYNIRNDYNQIMVDFLKMYCWMPGDKITIFTPTNKDELTITRLDYSEQKGYYNPYEC